MSYLSIFNLNKSYTTSGNILNNINLEINKGEVISIIGPSGNGKTTLLRCLSELETPDSGTIILNNNQIFPLNKTKPNIGLVFQSFNLFPQYNVIKNITLAMDNKLKDLKLDKKMLKLKKEENKAKAKELLRKLDLTSKEDNYPFELSGGQKQRVAIARALALNPDLLLFDEPTSALDPIISKDVVSIIKELKNEGNTIIVVTHDMEFAKEISDRVCFINKGKIEAIGNVKELLESSNSIISKFLG